MDVSPWRNGAVDSGCGHYSKFDQIATKKETSLSKLVNFGTL
jgi:hypothetical protein